MSDLERLQQLIDELNRTIDALERRRLLALIFDLLRIIGLPLPEGLEKVIIVESP